MQEHDQDVWIENHDRITDRINRIKNNEIVLSIFNYSKTVIERPKAINYGRVMSIESQNEIYDPKKDNSSMYN